jgi:hypothetical protein
MLIKDVQGRYRLGVTFTVICVIVLASFTNIVFVHTVTSSKLTSIKNDIVQKDLLFQTILDIANNKEILKIIQNSESRGSLKKILQPTTTKLLFIKMRFNTFLPPPSFLTKKYLEYAYIMGVKLSKTLRVSTIYSILERFQVDFREIYKEITSAIGKNNELYKKVEQLSDAQCNCEKNVTLAWHFPVICAILSVIWIFLFIIWIFNPYSPLIPLYYIITDIIITLCLPYVVL